MERRGSKDSVSHRPALGAVRLALLAGLALPALAMANEQSPPASTSAPAALDPSGPVQSQSPAAAAAPATAPVSKPKLAERVLHEREILGTRVRGNIFIDGLPLSPDGVQIGRALELRRARLGFVRQLPWRWEVQGSAEISSGRFELKDLYVRRHFDRLGAVTIGNQSEPMGLDELTSQLSQPLLEPSLPTALVPGRNFGITLGNRQNNFHYQVGVFGSGTEQEGRRDLGAAFSARLTYRVVDADDDIRHFGFALSDRKLSGTEQFRSVPEVGIGQEQLVDTGVIDGASSTLRASVEYIQTFDRWSVQGEVTRVRVRREADSGLQFGGAFIEATWMAWGDAPRYDDADAVLTRAPVSTHARWGDAWGRGNLALTARLSRIDLSDGAIDGGTETNVSLGAAWDVNARTRIAANIVRFVDLTGMHADAEDSTAIAVRFQYAW